MSAPASKRRKHKEAGASSTAGAAVSLASTAAAPHRPTAVLVHGLDSCKETWKGLLADLTAAGYPALALDLRGHGESPLGDPAHFSPAALASDVFATVAAHGVPGRFVLVGHSMGGRVAMRAAAMDQARVSGGAPPLLAACVIEDIDTKVRYPPTPADADLPAELKQSLRRWEAPDGRRYDSWEQCSKELLKWYESEGGQARVDSWRGSRVRELPGSGGAVWSDLNPAARRLAQATVLHSTDGQEAWSTLVEAGEALAFPLHLWIADVGGTVCDWEGEGGLEEMIAAAEGALGSAFQSKVYKGSKHSIHNTNREEFLADLKKVIDTAAVAQVLA